MKVAVISDAHGNLQGVEAVLEHMRQENPDIVIAAGDMVNPFPDLAAIWQLLHSEKIPYLKGNNEEYLVFHSQAADSDPLKLSPRFMPVRYSSSLFSQTDIKAEQPQSDVSYAVHGQIPSRSTACTSKSVLGVRVSALCCLRP